MHKTEVQERQLQCRGMDRGAFSRLSGALNLQGPEPGARGVQPGEHSGSTSPRWTPISLILSFQQYLKHFADIIWEALGCSHCCSTFQWAARAWPFRKEIKGGGHEGGWRQATSAHSYWCCECEKFWAASLRKTCLQHGTVFRSYQRLGFRTNNVGEVRGIRQDSAAPTEIIKS